MRRVRRSTLSAVASVCIIAACASGPRPSGKPLRESDYPGALVDSALLPSMFARQRIEARFGEHTMSFQAVLQVDAGVLSLLALTPYGTRAFLLEQRGQAVHFERYVDRELPFPPRFILVDVHRALFNGAYPLATPQPDGTHSVERDGERITERWHGGSVRERAFERLDGKPAGVLRITYAEPGLRAGGTPPRIDIHNVWFDYALVIKTL
jgi:hypothetical protein